MTRTQLLESLLKEVKRMCELQKCYFKTRVASVLEEAKAQEKIVDSLIVEISKTQLKMEME